jgi:murein DD-endopeptidase MepM/ murein hydrolase activator NlpD
MDLREITVCLDQIPIFADMPIFKAKRKRIAGKLRSKFRLVVMNDETFEEKFSLRLSPMNVLVFGGTIALSLITITLYLIAFTGIREYIPGYADVNMRRNLVNMTLRTDSLTYKMSAQDKYLANILELMNDKPDTTRPHRDNVEATLYDSIRHLERSEDDSILRSQIATGDRYELADNDQKAFSSGIGSYSFFTPLKGTISSKFNPAQKHYGIDIVSGANEVIKSALDGTVVQANFTSEEGYVIAVQHSNNLVTIYKNNSALLKSVGDYIRAGEVIAVIGNATEAKNGPHLHFELWYNGSPVNPVDYISF